MKYAESIFDILYLLLAFVTGIRILSKSKNNIEKLMGLSVLILGIGDSFHLVARIFNYFIDKDFNMYLGFGKLVTSITMTLFYLLLYYILDKKENKKFIYLLVISRIILCLLPGNNWLKNDSNLLYGIIRNIPFFVLGLIMIYMYYKERNKYNFKYIWIYILLSFLFYIPVVLFSSKIPLFGMLMLPKTICYILIIITFYKEVNDDR